MYTKASDCFFIGSFAHKNNDTYHTCTWYSAGFELWKLDNAKELSDINKHVEILVDAAVVVSF